MWSEQAPIVKLEAGTLPTDEAVGEMGIDAEMLPLGERRGCGSDCDWHWVWVWVCVWDWDWDCIWDWD